VTYIHNQDQTAFEQQAIFQTPSQSRSTMTSSAGRGGGHLELKTHYDAWSDSAAIFTDNIGAKLFVLSEERGGTI